MRSLRQPAPHLHSEERVVPRVGSRKVVELPHALQPSSLLPLSTTTLCSPWLQRMRGSTRRLRTSSSLQYAVSTAPPTPPPTWWWRDGRRGDGRRGDGRQRRLAAARALFSSSPATTAEPVVVPHE